MSKASIIYLKGLEGFDENGNPLPEDTDTPTTTPDGIDEREPIQVQDENIRVVADQPIVDDVPISSEERSINEDITRETIDIEALEETIDNVCQQEDNVRSVSEQLEDTIADIRPSIESGGISNECMSMVLSLRERIKNHHRVEIGGIGFGQKYALEEIGLSKSVRVATTRGLLKVLCNEANVYSDTLKTVSITVFKSFIDFFNKVINVLDFEGRRANKLKSRLNDLGNEYKENVEFESTTIANALVKDSSGGIYTPKEFIDVLKTCSNSTSDIAQAIEKVTDDSVKLAERIKNEATSGDKNDTLKSSTGSVKEYFANVWNSKITVPRLKNKFIGLDLSNTDITNIKKENIEAKNNKFKTLPKAELISYVDEIIKITNNIKSARSGFGKIYEAKAKLSKLAQDLANNTHDTTTEEGKREAMRATNIIIGEGREQLDGLKDITKACSSGVNIMCNYVDLSINKGSKKSKDSNDADKKD